MQGIGVTAPAPLRGAPGRHHQDRSDGWRYNSIHSITVQLELVRRVDEVHQGVVTQRRLQSLVGGLVAVAQRLNAPPAHPVAGRERFTWEMVDELKRPKQVATSHLWLWHRPRFRFSSPRSRPEKLIPVRRKVLTEIGVGFGGSRSA